MPQVFGQLSAKQGDGVNIGAVVDWQRSDRGIICNCGNALLAINVLAPNLFRIRVTTTEEFSPRRSWAVAIDDQEWAVVDFDLQTSAELLTIKTTQMRFQIQLHPCRIDAFDLSGRVFAKDANPSISWQNGTIVGSKSIEPDEHFYGFGERTGFLDKLAECKTNWTNDALDYGSLTDAMYQAIPFFIALRPQVGYGIFFNTTFWSQFDLGAEQPEVWQMRTHNVELDYYLIYGPAPAQILQTYTQLTGRMPLPPLWSLGYHQCRWSYESELVVNNLAEEFRHRQIPCDVIHLDIDYMRGYRVFTWNLKRFADPAQLIANFNQRGFKVVTIIDPGVKYEPEADYLVFDQGTEHDYFVRDADGRLFHGYVWPDKAVFPDFLRADVRYWWGDLHKSLTDLGVVGIWNDMNEPALDDRPFGDRGNNKVWFPLDAPQGSVEERATHAEVHNLYGLSMARSSYEGLQRLRSEERSFVLTRSGYAGIQRWSSVWMGDNQSLWEHLEMSLPMLCNMGLSGVSFVGCDIGGFAGNATAELFARWMQVGMLYPLMRAHSALHTAQHEPWVFGDRVEAICREYIELRYRLLPYIYSLFYESATTGAPILRPLLYHYPNDLNVYKLYDQVLLGESLMAAPVYRPGVEHRAVYIPEGTWYDWWSDKTYIGPSPVLVDAPLERMPLFVKAGAIIPIQPVVQYVGDRAMTQLTVRIWPGEGEFTLYEDDGHTFAYQDGVWSTTTYQVCPESPQVKVNPRQGLWQPLPRQVTVELVGVGEQSFQDDGSARVLIF